MMLVPYWIIYTKSIKKSYENGHTLSVELLWLFIFASDVYLNIMNDSLDDLNHMKFYFNPHMVYNWHQINIIQNHFPIGSQLFKYHQPVSLERPRQIMQWLYVGELVKWLTGGRCRFFRTSKWLTNHMISVENMLAAKWVNCFWISLLGIPPKVTVTLF